MTQEKDLLEEFCLGQGYIAIPLRQSAVGHFEVRSIINGMPVVLILDTGASGTVLDRETAQRLELPLTETGTTGGGLGTAATEVATTRIASFAVGKLQLVDFTVAVIDFSHVNEALKKAGIDQRRDGVIGVDVLRRFQAVIDYGSNTLFVLPEKPPVAAKKNAQLEMHGDIRIDPYLWLRNRDDAEVIAYLDAENTYFKQQMARRPSCGRSCFRKSKGGSSRTTLRCRIESATISTIVAMRRVRSTRSTRDDPGRRQAMNRFCWTSTD